MASRFWVGGSGTWDATNTANWSATTGGAGGASVPGAADTVTIDTGSGSAITVTIASGYNPSITSFTITANTLNLNNNTLTAVTGSITNLAGTARGIAFGTGQINLSGNNAVVWNSQVDGGITMTGSRNIYFTYAGGTGTRTIRTSSMSGGANSYVNMFFNSGTDTLSITGGSGFVVGNLNMTGFSGSMAWNQFFIYGNMTLSATANYTGTPVGTFYLVGSPSGGTQVIDFAGKPTPCSSINAGYNAGSTTTYQFVNTNINLTGALTLTAGTLDLATYNNNISAASFSSNNSNTRRIIWGSGTFTLTGTNNTTIEMSNQTNMSWTNPAPTWTLSGAGASGQTRTFNCGSVLGGAASKSPSLLVQSGADFLSINGNYTNLNFGTFSGTLTGGAKTFYGNVTLLPGLTHIATSNAITYAPPANVTTSLTTANVIINSPTIINGSGTFVLNDSLITGNANTSTLTLSGGTFNANSQTVNAWSFASTTGVSRSLNANTINLFGYNTSIITIYTSGWTTVGTTTFNLTSSANTGTRTITSTLTSAANNFDVNILSGTDNVSVTGSVLDIDFTGYSGNLNQGTNMSVFGNVILSNTMAVLPSSYQIQCNGTGNNTIATNGCVLKMPIAFNGTGTYSLQDNLNIANVSPSTYSIQYNGNLNLNNYTLATPSWQISGGRSINFGTSGQMVLTGTNGTIWSAPAITSFSLIGNVLVSANTAAAGTRTFNNGGASGGSINNALTVDITSGSNDTLSFNGHFANIDLTGWAGTWTNQNTTMYGNLTFPVGTTALPGNNTLTLGGINNVYTFDTSDVPVNFPITVNASNTTVTWANDVIATSTSPALTVASGNLVANVNVTAGGIVLTGSANRSIVMGDNTWTFKATGTVWNQTANTVICNIVAGNSTVIFSNDTSFRNINFADGTVLNNVVIGGNTSSSQTTFNGNLTLNDISSTKTGNGTITFSADTVTTMTSFNISGSANNYITINSGKLATHSLVLVGGGTVNTVDWLEIYNSNASPLTNTWYPGANSINGGGTIGWIWPEAITDTSSFFLVF